jgi:hypothetical protein
LCCSSNSSLRSIPIPLIQSQHRDGAWEQYSHDRSVLCNSCVLAPLHRSAELGEMRSNLRSRLACVGEVVPVMSQPAAAALSVVGQLQSEALGRDRGDLDETFIPFVVLFDESREQVRGRVLRGEPASVQVENCGEYSRRLDAEALLLSCISSQLHT